ncbi:unnamed protein product [Nippostrongylus brasiliensis]|uniref:AT30094p (inferred by orthology to a D. melanogaster protein) n=1 Tax=Nippostrongylus brasiliensis TaxID=27835 RepID=A0A0N4YSI7_NIPBR|nr:unnamed protein product [Nippostrongylus brasiliensis]
MDGDPDQPTKRIETDEGQQDLRPLLVLLGQRRTPAIYSGLAKGMIATAPPLPEFDEDGPSAPLLTETDSSGDVDEDTTDDNMEDYDSESETEHFSGSSILKSLLVDLCIVGVTKMVVLRPRPGYNIDDQTLEMPGIDAYSFPSGHTSRAAMLATFW